MWIYVASFASTHEQRHASARHGRHPPSNQVQENPSRPPIPALSVHDGQSSRAPQFTPATNEREPTPASSVRGDSHCEQPLPPATATSYSQQPLAKVRGSCSLNRARVPGPIKMEIRAKFMEENRLGNAPLPPPPPVVIATHSTAQHTTPPQPCTPFISLSVTTKTAGSNAVSLESKVAVGTANFPP
ncbi:hypothetical protein E2C01_052712 [Portunus trituberculatus]|uniref:Uncharacterized protein n=1 Tax=Portunus trituberculatus TaxID=210409 RepID=A0A5B7GML0_PORTR|nr:hypothetical protein [Portunus trituberculatus]